MIDHGVDLLYFETKEHDERRLGPGTRMASLAMSTHACMMLFARQIANAAACDRMLSCDCMAGSSKNVVQGSTNVDACIVYW